MQAARHFFRSSIVPCTIFVACAGIYLAVMGRSAFRASTGSPYSPHVAILADGWLRGKLSLDARPPNLEDWACYDTVTRKACPPGAESMPADRAKHHRWYVSFPPFPAVVILPLVALEG